MTAAVSARPAGAESAVAAEIARRAAALRHDTLPPDIRLLARQCLLDRLAVTLAAPVVGERAAERLARAVATLDSIGSMSELTWLCVPA